MYSAGALVLFCWLHGFQEKNDLMQQQKQKKVIRMISADIIVTKGGQFVEDLTKDDFKLFEDGKRVHIDSFKLFRVEEESVESQQHFNAPNKKLAVIFHDAHYWEKNIGQEINQIADRLIELAERGYEVIILQLSWVKGLEILQPFTSDELLIKKAVEKAARVTGSDKSFEDLWLDKPRIQEQEARGLGFEEKSVRQAYLDIERHRFEKGIGGILAACNLMKSLPGRKSILLVSDGLSDLSSPDMETVKRISSSESFTQRDTLDAIHIRDRGLIGKIRIFDPFNILKRKEFKSSDEVIKELIHFANAQNISLYSLDPTAFTKSISPETSAMFFGKEDIDLLKFKGQEYRRRVQKLRLISNETGAVSLSGSKKYDGLLQLMNTDFSYYYQLNFKPKRKKADNKYHKMEVKVDRRGVNVRSRKGYTDYSEEERGKILLVSVYYNPSLFKELPFEAKFVPFLTDSGNYEPWMNIAFPSKELFLDRNVEYGPKTFDFHFWIKEKKSEEKGFGGQIGINININSSFMNKIKTIDYTSIRFKGPELSFGHKEYQVIFALFDPQTNEIGTWESHFTLPDLDGKEPAFVNCVLGTLTQNPGKGQKLFSLSKKDGSLEYKDIKFFPEATDRFSAWQETFTFLQIYLPKRKVEIHPEFQAIQEDLPSVSIPCELVAETWDKKLKIWSGIFKLDTWGMFGGESTLKVEIPISEEGDFLKTEVKLVRFRP